MSSADPVSELVHDHADLNRRVLELGAIISGRRAAPASALAGALVEIREHLFLHFAREEEGLFPFVAERFPELAQQVDSMAVAHDAICGALARMCHMANETGPSALVHVFERFDAAYAAHARTEADLLRMLEERLDADDRAKLAALVHGL